MLVAEDPPAELFARISAKVFLDQYVQSRGVFIADLLGGIEGQACWHVESVTVRLVTGAISKVPAHNVRLVGGMSAAWGVDKSLQLGLTSVIGKTVVVKPGGLQAVVLDLGKRMPEDRVYKFLMTQPYSSCRHIWHVLRLYHRLVMAGATSEALAESVGSRRFPVARSSVGRLCFVARRAASFSRASPAVSFRPSAWVLGKARPHVKNTFAGGPKGLGRSLLSVSMARISSPSLAAPPACSKSTLLLELCGRGSTVKKLKVGLRRARKTNRCNQRLDGTSSPA